MTGIIGVDIGGTFTDLVCVRAGQVETVKVPTTVLHLEDAVLEGAQRVGISDITAFNYASTTGVNAILTRNIPKVGFVTTLGHRDILDMGRAVRPLEAQTDPNWRRSFGDAAAPLVPRYLRRGVAERVLSNGDVLIPLNKDDVRRELELLARCGVAGVAVCLLNSYVNPEHEKEIGALIEEMLGDVPYSLSAVASPLAKEFARASTTVVDALMKVILRDHSSRLRDGLRSRGFVGTINYANCGAMLVPETTALAAPHHVMFSGPAAGTVSGAYFGALIDAENLVCCDVGGTSCDMSLVSDGTPAMNTTFEIEHDLIVNTLTNDIQTIGAGGGSVVSISPVGDVVVGPESAGSDPGPACYDRGGILPTMTDACLLIGLLQSDRPLGGTLELNPERARAAFASLETSLSARERVLYAYRIGLSNISEGIADFMVRHGIDPREYSLLAYGSAGPMLLPAIMAETAVRSVIVPPNPGVFSAAGLVSSDLVFSSSRSAYVLLEDETLAQLETIFSELEADLLSDQELYGRGRIVRTFDGRLVGQTWETPFVPVPDRPFNHDSVQELIGNFHEIYERRWGQRFPHLPVLGVNYRAQLIVPAEKITYPRIEHSDEPPMPVRTVTLLLEDDIDAPEYRREDLLHGHILRGPALVTEKNTTIYVCEHQHAVVGEYGEIVIREGNWSSAPEE